MELSFYKYQGTGNDFIILDNRSGDYDQLTEDQINKLCDRRFGIGADGLMLLGLKDGYDFYMKYFNADGKEGSMCGNGGRCLVKFAYDMGIKKEVYHFLAVDGPHEATLNSNGYIRLKMQDVNNIQFENEDVILNTGSPHFIRFTSTLENLDVYSEGRSIRYNEAFKDKGINVNFVEKLGESIRLRTYERGVENETLSCGTGATAAAIAFAQNMGYNKVSVKVEGGLLEVEFNRIGVNECRDIWLNGPAEFVFKGIITI
jgi:diaminopimelate epimerase